MMIIFSKKADLVLHEIIERYKLDKYEALVKIDFVSKMFASDKFNDKNVSDFLEKELSISQQVSEKITQEIIENIIPLLIKVPEDKMNDPEFMEEISRQVSGEEKKERPKIQIEVEAPEKLNRPIGVLSALKREMQRQEIGGMIPKNDLEEENFSENELANEDEDEDEDENEDNIEETFTPEPEEQITQEQPKEAPKKQSGSDSYREPIE